MVERNSGIWRASLAAYAPLILWIGVIFVLSSEAASMSKTSLIIGPILHFLFPTASEETIQLYHGYIRKAAHFTEYAMLAFFAVRMLARSSQNTVLRWRYLLAIVLVAAIASLDEFHQSFEPSRTSSYLDVLLDIFGGSVMVTCLRLARWPRAAFTGGPREASD
jgi:VanZ family protein